MNKENIGWLVSRPCNDINFKGHLKCASIDELQRMLTSLEIREAVHLDTR